MDPTIQSNAKINKGVQNLKKMGKIVAAATGPYIMSKVLKKGTYELIDFDGNKLAEPRNGLYLKKYYA